MAINFCTLTNSTIDTFCGNRRQLILDRLIEEKKNQTNFIGTNNSSVRIDFAQRFPHLIRHVEDEDRTPLNFEQPFHTVTVELFGDTGTHQLDTTSRLDFVVVTDLQVGPPRLHDDVVVNISDFKVN